MDNPKKENLQPKFQTAEMPNDQNGFLIEPGNSKELHSERRLLKKIGGETLEKIYTHSYGLRDVGWVLLATGSIYVTKKGIEYFKREHPEDSEY